MATEMNVGTTERIGSTVAGLAVLGWALARPTATRLALGVVGAELMRRGITGSCLAYRTLGFDTAAPTIREEGDAAASDEVLCASEDSFPASDPPSWTPVTGARALH